MDVDELRGIAVDKAACCECKDQAAQVYCESCTDSFCVICYQCQHRHQNKLTIPHHIYLVNPVLQCLILCRRKGKRKHHKITAVTEEVAEYLRSQANSEGKAAESKAESGESLGEALVGESRFEEQSGEWYEARAKYIPMRLSYEERKFMRLLDNALAVSDYTSVIDGREYKAENKRLLAKGKEITSFFQALVVALDYKKGQQLINGDKDFKDFENFFKQVFEICRRYKIMNPDRMRADYGKLLYILQDCLSEPDMVEMLGFECIMPIKSVYSKLADHNLVRMLHDKLICTATMEIPDDKSKPRHQIQREIKDKNRAIEAMAQKYSNSSISEEEIKNCLYSIGDNYSFLSTNMVPVKKIIKYLRTYFRPDGFDEGYCLAISGGEGGARLSHSHDKQFAYVLQSLELWRDIAQDMFRLWQMAEDDLLNKENRYELKDTGQGINRVQPAPQVARVMRELIHNMQARTGGWIGSSVVHLGDHNVPNAFMFIEKYTQVSRILNPIVCCLERIETLMDNDIVKEFITSKWKDADGLRRDILVDFFRHAFDGSGADNFYDAGSCIDGRLTSAWNWCSQLERKDFYYIFKLNGFTGFDGEYQN